MIHVQFHNLRRRLLAGRAEFGGRGIFDLAVRHYRPSPAFHRPVPPPNS